MSTPEGRIPPQRGETTILTPEEETRFRAWARGNGIPDVDSPYAHYDYRGYWKAYGEQRMPFGEVHFPDTFKQHGHSTFSVESQYSTGDTDGGHWRGETYIPAPRGSAHLSPNAPGAHMDRPIGLGPLIVTSRAPGVGKL